MSSWVSLIRYWSEVTIYILIPLQNCQIGTCVILHVSKCNAFVLIDVHYIIETFNIKGVSSSERKTWSFQLSDKVEPVSTHIHWAIRNCNGDAEKLQSSLLNIVDHYKNIHTSCDPSSRCKKDKNYEPSRRWNWLNFVTKLERPCLSLRRSCPWGNFFKSRFHRFNTVPSIVLIYSISFFTYIFIDWQVSVMTVW
jgi:hypothetical protein